MRLTIFLILALLILNKIVSATVVGPTFTQQFKSLFFRLLPATIVTIMLTPIFLSFLFNKKFIAIWNFVISLLVIFVSTLLIHLANPRFDNMVIPALIIASMMYASFLTSVSLILSSTVQKWSHYLQEIFNRLSEKFKVVIVFIVYLLLVLPVVYSKYSEVEKYSQYLRIILIGETIAIIISLLILFFTFKKAQSLPQQVLSLESQKYYIIIMLVLLGITTIVFSVVVQFEGGILLSYRSLEYL